MIDLGRITKNNKALFLAYDQGMEHGPSDFDGDNTNPQNILDIAVSGPFTAVIFQKGVAEKYYLGSEYANKIPLILKLNGKTNLVEDPDPYSPQICSVEEAISIGASAVGYTIYVGSAHEPEMFKEFSQIEQEAHKQNVPLVGWMYIRGTSVEGKDVKDLTAYAARLGLELGADVIKIKYPGDEVSLKKAVESAGRTRVVVSGGTKEAESDFLNLARTVIDAGCIGMAVGRNIWQSENPIELGHKVKDIIWK